MEDLIELRGHRVLAYCGALPEEQERRQPFVIDLDLAVDVQPAGEADDLDLTVDYGAVCALVEEIATSQRFALLERFAVVVAEELLADDRITSVTVAVTKVRPPVPQDLHSSGVRISRSRR